VNCAGSGAVSREARCSLVRVVIGGRRLVGGVVPSSRIDGQEFRNFSQVHLATSVRERCRLMHGETYLAVSGLRKRLSAHARFLDNDVLGLMVVLFRGHAITAALVVARVEFVVLESAKRFTEAC
jgi:hypothetical protein